MSEIIISWLNDKILLSKQITSLTNELYNGYLYGELLHKYKCIDNFNQYIDSNEISDINTNYSLLSDALFSLNFHFPNQLCNEVRAGNKSSICLFIYKLKNFLERKECNFNQIILKTAKYKMSHNKILMPPLSRDKSMNGMTGIGIGLSSISLNEEVKTAKSTSTPKPFSLKKELISKQYYDSNNSLNVIHQTNNNNNKTSAQIGNINTHVVREETMTSKLTNNELNNSSHALASYSNINNTRIKDNYGGGLSRILDKRNSNYNISLNKIKQIRDKITNNSFHAELFISQMNRLGLKLNEFEMKQIKHKSSEEVEAFSKKLILNKLHKKVNEKLIIAKDAIKPKLTNSNSQIFGSNTSIALMKDNQHSLSKSVSSLNLNPSPNPNPIMNLTPLDIRVQYETKRLAAIKDNKLFERDEKFHCKLVKHIQSYKNYNSIEEEEVFNRTSYFSILDQEMPSIHKEKIITNEAKRRMDYTLMSMVFDHIFDFAYEALIYQTETNDDYVLVERWREWSNCFVKGELLRLPAENDDSKEIKRSVVEEKEDEDSALAAEFNAIAEFNCNDYLNYFGKWNIIIPIKMRSVEFRIEEIYLHAYFTSGSHNEVFEPTDEEINNITLPKDNSVKNYLLGDMVSGIIDSKYQGSGNGIGNSQEFKRSITLSGGKYSQLTAKLCFIGYPYSGRKTLAKRIQEEYPGIKVYIMSTIMKTLIKDHKRLSTPIEDNPKYKSMKKPQIDQMLLERDKELEDLKEIYEPLSRYIQSLVNNSSIEPSDDLLFTIFKYHLERDFNNTNTNANEDLHSLFKKKADLLLQLDNLKQENAKSKKPRLKEEEFVQKEINKITNDAYKGFICIDYPRTLNQFIQVENYFTGYIPEMNKPKTDKSILLDQLSSIIDTTPQQPNTNSFTQAGFDYVINFKVNATEIQRRYQGSQYDPVTGIYYHLDDNPPSLNDKKIKDRLIPPEDLSLTQFNTLIKEYDSTQALIKKFYQHFGNERLRLKTYQSINSMNKEDEIYNTFKNTTILQYLLKQIEEKEKDINEGNINIDLVTKDLSPVVTLNTNDQVTLINKQDSKVHLKKLNIFSINGLSTQSSINESILNQIKAFNTKYKSECLSFAKFILKQIGRVTKRIDLIQKVFIQFLSTPASKAEYIDIYMKKYTTFLSEHSNYISNPKVIQFFKDDIRLLSDKIWLVIQNSKQTYISEYIQIKNSGFIENESLSLYNRIESIFLSEASKYICFIDIITQYHIKSDMQNVLSSISPNDIKTFLTSKSKTFEQKIFSLFKGCFFLIAKIGHSIKDFINTKAIQTTLEGTGTRRTKKINSTLLSENKEGGGFGDEMRNVIQSTKQQFKYRIMILKYFSQEQYNSINKVYNDVISTMDQWIIQSIKLQNDSMNKLHYELNSALDEGRIPYINNIEHDRFAYGTINPSIYFNIMYNKENIIDKRDQIDIDSYRRFIEEIRKYESVPFYIKSNEFIKLLLMKIESKKEQGALSDKMKILTFSHLNKFKSKMDVCYLNDKDKYEAYIEINRVLTLFILSNCKVPTRDQIEDIKQQCKEKLINSTCLSKENFLKINYWFESMDSREANEMKETQEFKNTLFEINKIDNDNANYNDDEEEKEELIDIYQLCDILSIRINTNKDKSNNNKQLTYYDILFID